VDDEVIRARRLGRDLIARNPFVMHSAA